PRLPTPPLHDALPIYERARARRWTTGVRIQRLEVRVVEREVPLDPLRAAERLLTEVQLEDVVEHPPRAECLPRAVAFDVVREPGDRKSTRLNLQSPDH